MLEERHSVWGEERKGPLSSSLLPACGIKKGSRIIGQNWSNFICFGVFLFIDLKWMLFCMYLVRMNSVVLLCVPNQNDESNVYLYVF